MSQKSSVPQPAPSVSWALTPDKLRRLLPGISPKVLTQRLRELEASSIAWRQQDTMVPPRVTYGPTVMGNDVHASLKALDAPAGRWLPDR
jgi:DNA-binding HxlR family transcriptional regulator